MGHYEGRGWRGFHHHATLCIAAYGFLISEKETIPPSGASRPWRGSQSALSSGLPTQRICHCGHDATYRIPSPPCEFVSRALWFSSCHAVPAAGPSVRRLSSRMSDAVGLLSKAEMHKWKQVSSPLGTSVSMLWVVAIGNKFVTSSDITTTSLIPSFQMTSKSPLNDRHFDTVSAKRAIRGNSL